MNVTDDRQTDRQTTDGRTYSEREREFMFAKMSPCYLQMAAIISRTDELEGPDLDSS